MKICYIPQEEAPEIGNVNYISVQRPEGYQMNFQEGRKQHSFLYTLCGSMCYSPLFSDEKDIIAPCGELVFIPAQTRHRSSYIGASNRVMVIQFDIYKGTLPESLSKPSLISSEAASRIFTSIRNDLESGTGASPVYLLYRIYELLWHISRDTQKLPAKYRKLQTALHEIHIYYSDNHKILYYADLCGMSEPGFRRLFREYTNLSPIEYRNRIRLQEAKKLLASGEFSVEEAALAVGFSNLPFFCRSYKNHFGHSPGTDT